jgi:hypothetical protein
LNYTGRCRFGHTFRGSFGFTIESPLNVATDDDNPGHGDIPPFERRVIQRLASGLATAEEARAKEDPDIITAAYADGLNANMCEDIVALFNIAEERVITFEFAWSPQWEPPTKIPSRRLFKIDPEAVSVVTEAGNKLRLLERERTQTVSGFVTKLHSENRQGSTSQPKDGDVVVRWISLEYGRINVHVFLAARDYRLAVTAHRDGKFLSVTGSLEKVGRIWRLNGPHNVFIEGL